jgi:excisionase family DNA binding protein
MSTNDTAEEFLTPGQVARILHVSPQTVNRWANEGRIPCTLTLGGHRRFRRADVDAAVRRVGDQQSEG